MMYSKEEIMAASADVVKVLSTVFPDDVFNADVDRETADLAVEGIILSVYNGVNRYELKGRKVEWDLHRQGDEGCRFMFRLPIIAPLMRRWEETGKFCYPEAAVDYINDYIAAFPVVPHDVNSLDLCIRNAILAKHLGLFARCPVVDQAFLNNLIVCIKRESDWLSDNIKPNINWRVFNANQLLMTALQMRFLPESQCWIDHAVPVLNDALHRQFRVDMTHYECNPTYHIGMTHVFLGLWKLAGQMPELGLRITRDQVAPMFDFIAALARPNGYSCAIHDSQGDHAGNQKTATGQAAYGGHKGVNPLNIYDKLRRGAGLDASRPATSRYFEGAGLGLFRTGWEEDDEYVTFDATRWGGGHCHLSRNAIQLHAFRRSMIVDPGWLAYEANEWGVHGRSTRAHSTCTLNGLNQQIANPSRTEWYHADGYDAMFSDYDGGYWDTELKWNFTHAAKGLWASHKRTMLWAQKKFLFVVDSIYRLPRTPGDPQAERPSVECNWQLSEDAELTLAPDASRAVARWPEANLLMLFPIRPEGTTLKSHCGEKDPLRGWLPGEGDCLAAHQVSLTAERMEKQHDYFVSILIPSRGEDVPTVEVEAKSPLGTVGYVKLKWSDGTSDEIHWGCSFEIMIGKNKDFATDSSLVHIARGADGRVMTGCCINGTYMEPFTRQHLQEPETFLIS